MPEALQKIHNKDKSGIRFCPRCHAQNLTAQTVCGKCGLVFSGGTEKKGGKDGNPFAGSHAHGGAAQPPPLPGSPGMGGNRKPGAFGEPSAPADAAGEEEGNGGEAGGSGEDDKPPQQPKPKRPDTLPEKGATEGPIREMSGAPACPHCGAELKEGLRRCPRCGFKIGKR